MLSGVTVFSLNFIRKELDGWEPHENPWDEHAKRDCPFIKKGKKSRDLTVEEYFDLEAERLCLMFVRRRCNFPCKLI